MAAALGPKEQTMMMTWPLGGTALSNCARVTRASLAAKQLMLVFAQGQQLLALAVANGELHCRLGSGGPTGAQRHDQSLEIRFSPGSR